jgi:hypothetical protein
MTTTRYAIVKGGTAEAAAAYLPGNYSVVGTYDVNVVIAGEDVAGWTLDDYVIPRLASGLYFATELVTT